MCNTCHRLSRGFFFKLKFGRVMIIKVLKAVLKYRIFQRKRNLKRVVNLDNIINFIYDSDTIDTCIYVVRSCSFWKLDDWEFSLDSRSNGAENKIFSISLYDWIEWTNICGKNFRNGIWLLLLHIICGCLLQYLRFAINWNEHSNVNLTWSGLLIGRQIYFPYMNMCRLWSTDVFFLSLSSLMSVQICV